MQSYAKLIEKYHYSGRDGRCPWCREEWPCTPYREVIGVQKMYTWYPLRHGLEAGDVNVKSVLPTTPDGVGEMAMHYGEAVEWISALEDWIRRQGLEVPTWAEVRT